MAASGRPTPQAESRSSERPRFRDRTDLDFKRPDINPFLVEHRTFGPELLPADQAWRHRGDWAAVFGREAPLHVEIGSGNGFFLAELAARNPEWNVLGIEIRYKRVVLCAKKIRKGGVGNARIARYHAAFLDDLFEPGSLSGLYVNHPDPWPKTRHDKNRLISRWFLEDVVSLLKPGGWFRLKSDFKPNVDRAVELLDRDGDGAPAERLPLEMTGRSDDVITGEAPWPDDIETNYQSKFRLKGEPVYAVELVRQ
jgi:tRNA (guanine-N7-)-methyltransferase